MLNYSLLVTSTRNISQNSKEAYYQLKRNGHFKNRTEQILHILSETSEPLTRRELATIIGCEPSSVSHPVKRLLSEDKIIQVGKKKNSYSRLLADSFTLKRMKSDE